MLLLTLKYIKANHHKWRALENQNSVRKKKDVDKVWREKCLARKTSNRLRVRHLVSDTAPP